MLSTSPPTSSRRSKLARTTCNLPGTSSSGGELIRRRTVRKMLIFNPVRWLSREQSSIDRRPRNTSFPHSLLHRRSRPSFPTLPTLPPNLPPSSSIRQSVRFSPSMKPGPPPTPSCSESTITRSTASTPPQGSEPIRTLNTKLVDQRSGRALERAILTESRCLGMVRLRVVMGMRRIEEMENQSDRRKFYRLRGRLHICRRSRSIQGMSRSLVAVL